MKKFITALLVCILLGALGTGLFLYGVKPYLTLKNSIDSLQNTDGHYEISISKAEETQNNQQVSFSMDRQAAVFGGEMNIPLQLKGLNYNIALDTYVDLEQKDVMIGVGRFLKAVVPEDTLKTITGLAGLFGLSIDLDSSYISASQITGLMKTLQAESDLAGPSEVIESMQDHFMNLSDYSLRFSLPTQKPDVDLLPEEDYYYYELQKKEGSGRIIIGCKKDNTKDDFTILVYTEDDSMGKILISGKVHAQETHLEMPDSLLSEDAYTSLIGALEGIRSFLGK